jgi:hypothetical protein
MHEGRKNVQLPNDKAVGRLDIRHWAIHSTFVHSCIRHCLCSDPSCLRGQTHSTKNPAGRAGLVVVRKFANDGRPYPWQVSMMIRLMMMLDRMARASFCGLLLYRPAPARQTANRLDRPGGGPNL